MLSHKSRCIIIFSVVFIVFFSLQVNSVQGVGWETTIEITIGVNLKYSYKKNCSVGDKITIEYNVQEGPSINAYLMDSENGSNFLTGGEFTYIESDQNSRSGSWTYTVSSAGYYGIFIHNNNDEEVTVWFKFTRTEPAGGGAISLGFYFLIPTIFGIFTLILISKRSKLNSKL